MLHDKQPSRNPAFAWDAKAFGARVREERNKRGWTQAQLAGTSGLGEDTITNIETGRRTPQSDSLLALANAFKMSVEDLTRGLPPAQHSSQQGAKAASSSSQGQPSTVIVVHNNVGENKGGIVAGNVYNINQANLQKRGKPQ